MEKAFLITITILAIIIVVAGLYFYSVGDTSESEESLAQIQEEPTSEEDSGENLPPLTETEILEEDVGEEAEGPSLPPLIDLPPEIDDSAEEAEGPSLPPLAQ